MAAEIQFNVDQAIAKLGELVSKHGPQAVDLAASVIQVDALGSLLFGAAMIPAAVLTWRAARKAFTLANRKIRNESYRHIEVYRDQFGWWMATSAGAAATLVFALIAASNLLHVWNWVALFNPKLALAHEVLSKVGL